MIKIGHIEFTLDKVSVKMSQNFVVAFADYFLLKVSAKTLVMYLVMYIAIYDIVVCRYTKKHRDVAMNSISMLLCIKLTRIVPYTTRSKRYPLGF